MLAAAAVVKSNVTIDKTSYLSEGLNYSSPYSFEVKAKNEMGWGDVVVVASKTLALRPDTPKMQHVDPGTSITPTSIYVQWEAPVNDRGSTVLGYNLEAKRAGKLVYNASLDPAQRDQLVPSLVPYTEYSIRVQATTGGDGQLHSYFSEDATLSDGSLVRTKPTVPGQPGSMAAVAGALGQSIQLNWEQVGRRCCRHCCCRCRRHSWYHRCCGSATAPPPLRVSATHTLMTSGNRKPAHVPGHSSPRAGCLCVDPWCVCVDL